MTGIVTLCTYAQKAIRLFVFACIVCVCCVCLCVTKKRSFTHLLAMFSQKGCILLIHFIHFMWCQRCLLDLLSCTESTIPLISIHTIVHQGSGEIFSRPLVDKHYSKDFMPSSFRDCHTHHLTCYKHRKSQHDGSALKLQY